MPHDIEVRREGFEPYRTRVTPRPGASLEVKARLQTLEQAREARTPPVLRTTAGQRLKLEVVGQDRRGITAQVSTLLAERRVNVEELITEVEAAPMGGGTLFRLTATLSAPNSGQLDVDALRAALEQLGNELMVDIASL